MDASMEAATTPRGRKKSSRSKQDGRSDSKTTRSRSVETKRREAPPPTSPRRAAAGGQDEGKERGSRNSAARLGSSSRRSRSLAPRSSAASAVDPPITENNQEDGDVALTSVKQRAPPSRERERRESMERRDDLPPSGEYGELPILSEGFAAGLITAVSGGRWGDLLSAGYEGEECVEDNMWQYQVRAGGAWCPGGMMPGDDTAWSTADGRCGKTLEEVEIFFGPGEQLSRWKYLIGEGTSGGGWHYFPSPFGTMIRQRRWVRLRRPRPTEPPPVSSFVWQNGTKASACDEPAESCDSEAWSERDIAKPPMPTIADIEFICCAPDVIALNESQSSCFAPSMRMARVR